MARGGKREGAGRKPKAKTDVLENLKARKRLYLEGLVKGKTKKQAALDAGYAESVAKTAKAHIETEDVRLAFAELMRVMIPSEKIAARIVEGLDATVVKLFSYQGQIYDREELVDFAERREYAKLAAELAGYYIPTQKREIDGSLQLNLAQKLTEARARIESHRVKRSR